MILGTFEPTNLKIDIHISVGKTNKYVNGFCMLAVRNGDMQRYSRFWRVRALVSYTRAEINFIYRITVRRDI